MNYWKYYAIDYIVNKGLSSHGMEIRLVWNRLSQFSKYGKKINTLKEFKYMIANHTITPEQDKAFKQWFRWYWYREFKDWYQHEALIDCIEFKVRKMQMKVCKEN